MLLRPSTDIHPKELARDMRGFFNSLLEVPDFGRRRIVVVVRAVVVGHGGADEFIDIDLVEAIHAHGIKLAAESGFSPHPKERTPQCLQKR